MASAAGATTEPLELLPAKRKKTIDWKKCLICQGEKSETLREASATGIETVFKSSQMRRDDVYDRIIPYSHNELLTKELSWHRSCYASYTSKRNLSFVGTADKSTSDDRECETCTLDLESRSSRSNTSKIDWTLCMFCQRIKHKGVKTLIKVSTFDACQSIFEAAEARGDLSLITNIRGVDLIAADAKYHSACRASYVSKSNLKHRLYKEENASEECVYENAFQELMTEIEPGISAGKAYDMSFLLESFKAILSSKGISSQAYRSEKLKKRLINHFSDSVVFHKQPDPSKPELIYSSSLSVQSIINAAANISKPDKQCSTVEVGDNDTTSRMKVLFHAAQILRADIKSCKGICIQPLLADDISLDKSRQVIPDSLYSFLCWFVSQAKDFEFDTSCKHSNLDEERRVLMLAQDMIHTSTHSRVKTPKHVGLAITVHHLTGSKQLVTLLNKMGHCSSYDDVEVVYTSLAREISARSEEFGVIVPSNITPGGFVQFAADNNDLNEDTLDGKQTTHATTIVAFQREPFGPKPPPRSVADHSTRRRSLEAPVPTQTIHEFGVRGRKPSVTSFLGTAQNGYNSQDDKEPNMDSQDFAWFLLRLNKNGGLLSIIDEINESQQTTPSWSAFHAMVSAICVPRTNIGYCPMIAGSSTEYSTIYTVMKTIQAITVSLGQNDSVVTFDLAIYKKAKEIQWRYPNEFKHLVIRMGGFHIALNFLSAIGKKFQESGIEDLLMESGLYGSSSTVALLKGKSYNRGVRAHKLIMEALLRLQWKAFGQWVERTADAEQLSSLRVDQVQSDLRRSKEAARTGKLKDAVDVLCESASNLHQRFNVFKREPHSQLFKFWDSYIEMILVLLRFIKAEREGNWELHLQSTAEMVPHFFCMDKTNYSRWLPIYLADMRLLEENAPEVHNEFLTGSHSVSRSSGPFSQIWTDMALEQTVNLDSKSKGGIVGISQKPGALERWFLTAHERAAVTTATKELCGVCNDEGKTTHKEGGSLRVKRDEEDVKKLVTTLTSVMTNPFDEENDDRDTFPLSNLATGVIMPPDMATRLLHAAELGRREMKSFISNRINSNAVGFWDSLPKMKIKTFSDMTKKVQVKASDEKLITLNADRSLFARLLIASGSRTIDLREVMKYELSPVPCALAHTDGTLRKSTKSVLLSVLEGLVQVSPRLPSDDDEPTTAYVMDGMAVVQMVKTAGARTFGEMAGRYFDTITSPLRSNNCNRVDVVFDRYDKADSIKESERRRRGSASGFEIKIAGPNTPVPKKWNAYIANAANKVHLQHFLGTSWATIGRTMLRTGQQLVLAGCFPDPQEVRMVERAHVQPLSHLLSDHEEADTRMMLHAVDCSQLHQRVVVQSPDTDVAVLAIHVSRSLSCDQIWMKTGVKDKLRFIPIHAVAQKLKPDLCSLLPAFHALTGCDTTSGPYKIGKKKSWKVLQDNTQKYAVLTQLGEEAPLSPEVARVAEQYICSLYSTAKRAGTTADDVRYWIFCQKKQQNDGLPPTSNSIQHHIQRANYQTMVWKRCLQPIQRLPSPFGNGWEMSDNLVKPVLMSKDPAPEGLTELTVCKCNKSSCKSSVQCTCRKHEMPCIEACGCMADECCQNPQNLQVADDSDSSGDEM